MCQSFRATDVPPWIARCLESVLDWTRRRGYEYEFVDDALFEMLPQWYRQKVAPSMFLLTDLARLLLVRALLGRGYDRAIWVDADVLVFDPEAFDIHVRTEYAFTREVFLRANTPADGPAARDAACWDVDVSLQVNNSVAVFVRDNSFLDFYIESCQAIVAAMHPQALDILAVGTRFLSNLAPILRFPLLDGVGHLCPAVMRELEDKPGRFVAAFAALHGSPIHAANLNATLQTATGPATWSCDIVVDRLLRTRGAVINQAIPTAAT